VFANKSESDNKIILIDFGMAHQYVNPKRANGHIAYGMDEDFKGTPSFSSVGALRGYVQSRRDDLESLVYVLMYASTGNLPWQQYRHIKLHEEKVEKIIDSKSNIFCYDYIKEIPTCLTDFLKYCKSLQFREVPDYKHIEGFFQSEESIFTKNTEMKINSSIKIVTIEIEESKCEKKIVLPKPEN
jgi:casein kinase 1